MIWLLFKRVRIKAKLCVKLKYLRSPACNLLNRNEPPLSKMVVPGKLFARLLFLWKSLLKSSGDTSCLKQL